jgi:hypothetical protein
VPLPETLPELTFRTTMSHGFLLVGAISC